jgi:hypothetical protein
MSDEATHGGGEILVVEYEASAVRGKLQLLAMILLPAGVLAASMAVTHGAFVLWMYAAMAAGLLAILWLLHRASLGRRVILGAEQRTLTFVRPMRTLVMWPGPGCVVPFDGVRSVQRFAHRGADQIFISGQNDAGRRVSFYIDSWMTNYDLAWEFLCRYLGDRVPKRMTIWKFALVLLGVLVAGLGVIVAAVVFVFWMYGGFGP